ncbi:MAG TPA: S53 family peptidase [Ktedonosporobacter sp.]|nr:S53 family peptidase [Ktedonosporobacter sp.]
MPLFPRHAIWQRGHDAAIPMRDPRHYGHIAAIVAPFLALLMIGGCALQSLHMAHVQADKAMPLIALTNTRSPLIASSYIQGPADLQQHISLSLGLRPRNQASMDSYMEAITQPASANYRHFLTNEQSANAFSPDEATYARLNQFLQQAGFTTQTYSHRLLISFTGTIGQVEQAFHTQINTYIAPNGQSYYASATDPLLPQPLAGAVQSILGLDNAVNGHRSLLPMSNRSTRHVNASPCPVHASGYFMPDQLASAYNINGLYAAHDQGEGQTVALVELATFTQSDVSAYTACFGHSRTPIQTIRVGRGPVPDIGMFEATMDAELILGVAPQLARLKIYEAANTMADYMADWARILQDAPPIVSSSWGFCEALISPAAILQENNILQRMALQGETVIASSGDNGDAGCPPSANSAKAPLADDPGAQPYVTSVGGSSLTLKPGTSSYGKETAWNSLPSETTGFVKGGSGGGISQFWPRPAWQSAPGVDTTPFSHVSLCGAPTCRETPDVSLNADPVNGYLVYCTSTVAQCAANDPWSVAAGTSASAPMWAGIIALANELAHKQNRANLGFINPLLYQIASNPARYAASFHDITTGTVNYSNGTYSAGPGYDLATGLGSCNAYGLATNLAAVARTWRGPRS